MFKLLVILFIIKLYVRVNPLSANPTKWPSTLKQFVGKLLKNFLSVFGHFVNLVLKEFIYFNFLNVLNSTKRWLSFVLVFPDFLLKVKAVLLIAS